MTRTPYLTPEQMDPQQRRIYNDIVASRGTWLNGPYAPMLLQPNIAEPAQRLGEFLRFNTSLGARLSELAILVVARHWDCDFEWHAHAAIALRSQIPAGLVESIRLQQEPAGLREDEALVYGFTRQLLEHRKIDAVLYERGQELLGVVGIVELTALIGYYTFIALTLNAHEVPLPAGVQPPLRHT